MTQISSPAQETGFDEDFFEWEERDDSISYVNHCIAGSIAGVAEHVLLLPFDSIKTHMQVHDGRLGVLATAKDLYKAGGLSAFWRGASALVSGCIPAHAAYFSVYEFFKRKLLPKFHDERNEIYPYAYALTGVFATSIHDFIMTPFDTIKQRKQIAPENMTNTQSLLKHIVKNEGLTSLYRGFPITLLMNVPQAAAVVSVNETLKVLYKPTDGHNFITYLVCAAIAGASAAIVTIPLDNVKTRLQTQTFYQDSRNSNVPSEPTIKYQDILSTMKTILREEGPKGFVKGLLPRVIAQAPSSAVSWTAYEMMKKYLNNKKH